MTGTTSRKENANPTIVTTTETLESRKKSILYQRLCQNELDGGSDNNNNNDNNNNKNNNQQQLQQQQRSQWDVTIDEFLGVSSRKNIENSDTKPTVEDYVSYHTLREVVTNYDNNNSNDNNDTNSPVSILQHIGIWDELLLLDRSTSTSVNNINNNRHRNVFYTANDTKKDILDCINLFSLSNNNSITTSTMKKKQQQNTTTTMLSCEEIYEIIRTIQDPEHPLTLEQLGVVSLQQVHISHTNTNSTNQITNILINFTPTIPHCSMATLIGLCIRVKLLRSLSVSNSKIQIKIQSGTHNSEHAINKQLNDKERVYAAIENTHLLSVVNNCIRNSSSV